jgi:hypothetical protein
LLKIQSPIMPPKRLKAGLGFLCLVVLSHFAQGQIVDAACKGNVGTYSYDITKLAAAVTTDQTCIDANQNLYYFRPCRVLQNEDCKNTEPSPGVCQRDTRRPPAYHDLGSITTAAFSQLPNGDAAAGFLLTYTGGEEDRLVDIQFICDKSIPGTGYLQCGNPAEQPGKHYHLVWRTSYACPQGNVPTNELYCCLYQFSSNPELTKVLCLEATNGTSSCPSQMGQYFNIGSWPVESCSNCFFKKENK